MRRAYMRQASKRIDSMDRPRLVLSGLLLILIAACRSGFHGRGDASPWRSHGETLSSEDFQRCTCDNVYELLQNARPIWLADRGRRLSVSIDGAMPVDIDFLRNVKVSTVQEVRLVRVRTSAEVAPTVLPNGAVEDRDLIIVTTRRY